MERKRVLKKSIKIASDILLYLFIALCILSVVVTIVAKKDADGTVTFFGQQMRVVLSSSMEKCDETDVSQYEIKDIPVKSMVFIETVPKDKAEAEKWYSELKIGDVLTFKYVFVAQETITHRIKNIEPQEGGGYIITLQGDNKASPDSELIAQVIDTRETTSPNYVVGKVTGQSYFVGLMVSTLKSNPLGLIFIVIVPCLIIIILEVFKIVKLVYADKRKKEKEEHESELELLKRRLAALEAEKTGEDNSKKEE